MSDCSTVNLGIHPHDQNLAELVTVVTRAPRRFRNLSYCRHLGDTVTPVTVTALSDLWRFGGRKQIFEEGICRSLKVSSYCSRPSPLSSIINPCGALGEEYSVEVHLRLRLLCYVSSCSIDAIASDPLRSSLSDNKAPSPFDLEKSMRSTSRLSLIQTEVRGTWK